MAINLKVKGTVTVGRNHDGRLEVFARGEDSALWHIYQHTPNGQWSEWSSLGGQLADDPVAASNFDGRLEVFAQGSDQTLYHIWQVEAGKTWSDWAQLGGVRVVGKPAVICNHDKLLEIFIRDESNKLRNIRQKPASEGGGWYPWSDLEGSIIGNPAAIIHGGVDHMVVCARGEGERLHMRERIGKTWFPWKMAFAPFESDPVMVHNKDNLLFIFARSSANILCYLNYDNEFQFCTIPGIFLRSDPAIGMNSDSRLEIFVTGDDYQVWHVWEGREAPKLWSDWAFLGGGLNATPTVGRNEDGRLEIFIQALDNTLWHCRQPDWDVKPMVAAPVEYNRYYLLVLPHEGKYVGKKDTGEIFYACSAQAKGMLVYFKGYYHFENLLYNMDSVTFGDLPGIRLLSNPEDTWDALWSTILVPSIESRMQVRGGQGQVRVGDKVQLLFRQYSYLVKDSDDIFRLSTRLGRGTELMIMPGPADRVMEEQPDA